MGRFGDDGSCFHGGKRRARRPEVVHGMRRQGLRSMGVRRRGATLGMRTPCPGRPGIAHRRLGRGFAAEPPRPPLQRKVWPNGAPKIVAGGGR